MNTERVEVILCDPDDPMELARAQIAAAVDTAVALECEGCATVAEVEGLNYMPGSVGHRVAAAIAAAIRAREGW